MSCEATATNALTLPSRSASSARQRLEVGVGQAAERDGQDVELARLDEREEEGQRPVELGELDVRGGLGSAALAEADGRRPSASARDRRRRRRSAAMTGTPASRRRRASVGLVGELEQLARRRDRRRVLVADQLDGPWRAAGRGRQSGRGLGVVAQPVERGAPAGHDAGEPPDPRAVALAERVRDPRPRPPCRPCRRRGAGRRAARPARSRRRRAAWRRRRGRGAGRRRASRRTARAARGSASSPAPRAPPGPRGPAGATGTGGP